ncbi:MAG: FAD:protein FMN transferase [Vicinamibacterales bacterium]
MLAVAACAGVTIAGGPSLRPFEYQQVHMGLPVRILLHAPDSRRAEITARAAFERIAVLDRMMSDYRPDSEVRRLETAGQQWTPVSAELLDVLATSVSVARATDGAFDPTVGPLVALWREARATGTLPAAAARDAARARVGWRHLEIDRARGAVRLGKPGMRLDLGGIAKGYILQQALESLRANGVARALIESGGDVVAGDRPPDRAGWRIDTPAADAVFTRRADRLANAALATSGATEQFVEIGGVRYGHIVDPRTGVGITHRTLARVIARDAAIADALATALSVAGPEGAKSFLHRFPDVVVSFSTPGGGSP